MAKTSHARIDWRTVAGAMLATVSMAGCGESGPVTKEVRGVITFNGGTPPAPGKITLAPIEVADSLPRRPARGEFDEKGRFTLTTFEAGDGIIPGRYTANITCWREKPTLATRISANYVPPDFEHEVTIEIDADEPIDLTIDVPTAQRGN
jgi:hypothetical protein